MAYIRNRTELLTRGDTRLRAAILDIAECGLAAADPGQAVRQQVALQGDKLTIAGRIYPLAGRRVFVIGAGKASFPIAKGLDDILGERIHAGLVTCKYGQQGTLSHIDLHLAGHPLPDEASAAAATRTLDLLATVRPGDIVLACFTGGSSSLFVLPATGIDLEDKVRATSVLLCCGANITEINAVRKHLSRVKGGRIAGVLPAGSYLVNLTISDVIGDALDCITDPSVPDTSSFADARATLDKYALWDCLPAAICRRLRDGAAGTETMRAADLAHVDRYDVLLAAADVACRAATAAGREKGFNPLLLSTFFEGESRELGRSMAAVVRQILFDGHPTAAPCLLVGGGETTVRLDGAHGQGGPNQEFAASIAIELAGHAGVVALALDTDGTDGPTDVAGALVDGTTLSRGRSACIDFHASLARHDVTPAFISLGDAVMTGATGTNVNDLKLVIIAPTLQT